MSYDSETETAPRSSATDIVLIERTRSMAFDLIGTPPCILDADFLLDVIDLGDRLEKCVTK